jgi:hypothetical protein
MMTGVPGTDRNVGQSRQSIDTNERTDRQPILSPGGEPSLVQISA